MNYCELTAKLADLEAEITAVRAAGEVLADARIDSSKAGGTTARGQPSTQYRLRIQGQKTRYLKASEVAVTRAAIHSESKLSSINWQRQPQHWDWSCQSRLGLELCNVMRVSFSQFSKI